MLLHHSRAFTDAAPYVLMVDKENPYSTPYTVTVTPGAGSTLTVAFSYNFGRTYVNWALGGVTVETSALLPAGTGPTHIKVTQTVASTESFLTVTK